MSSSLLDLAIFEIEGVEHKRAFLGLEGYPRGYDGDTSVMSSADASFLRDEMEEVNGGLITTFDVECVTHGEVAVDLPFRDNFLLPKRRRR
jgi:hypothetical protein